MTTPPSNPAPDYTIANNPHAFVHCGPIGPGSQDDGRDFCIITSKNNHCVYHTDGSKVEHIQDAWHEVSGCLLYTSPSPRDQRGSRMPSSA